MFKTVYRLSLLVQETLQYFPIQICALKEKEPTFIELTRKIERIMNTNDLNDYYIETMDKKSIISDDQSFQNALKLLSPDQSKLEIILYRRKSLLLGDTNKLPITKSNVIELKNNINTVPLIRPTVLRWTTPAVSTTTTTTTTTIEPITNNHIRRYSSISQDDTIDYRKDSGISMDEPHHNRKKQRVMSAEHHHHHSRKLPDPPIITTTIATVRKNSMTSLHPLDMATRPSTAPPSSSSPPASPYPRLMLPALSSITTSPIQQHHTQLAPIHRYHNNKRSKSIATTHSSIFLCEHVNDHGKVCGQTFRRSYDLSRHQTIHLENRPFCYCDKCGKRFTRMDALRRHERVQGHTSSKQRSMSMIPLQKTTV